MSERFRNNQHWFVIIGTLVTVIFTIYTRVYAYGELNNRVENQGKQIVEVKTDLGTRPTKTEFEMMKGSIDRIDGNVKQLTTYLLGKR